MTAFLFISLFVNFFMFLVWTKKNFFNLFIKMFFGIMTIYSTVLLFPILQTLVG